MIKLLLENGEVYTGLGEAPEKPVAGEVVFNTGMSGYQEVFTDPSYCDQIIVMTAPLVGNYGVNLDASESLFPACKAVIAREFCDTPSHWQSRQSIKDFMREHGVSAMEGVDTRKLVRSIRERGSLKGVLAATEVPDEDLRAILSQELPRDQVARVGAQTVSRFPQRGGPRIVMMDFGHKKSILSALLERGCDVVSVPYNADLSLIKSFSPAGILLSNGPGDPQDVEQAAPVIKELQQLYPLFGICLGHQLFAIANGATTEKMKFGHRGANHPVKDLEKNKVFITAQNHGYTVNAESIAKTELSAVQTSLNDGTIEALRHQKLPAFSVQYHPEAAPGPNDTLRLFDEFVELARKRADKENQNAQRR